MGEVQLDGRIVQQLYQKAGGSRWGLSIDRFRLALEASIARGAEPRSLHLEDLALAAACADGLEAAWEHFIREHRPVLYRAADAIDRTGAAREAADSLYAELFGLAERDGERRSLLRYFHGRSSLATWLRAVLAQRYVDHLRRARRSEPLPADDDPVGADIRSTHAVGADLKVGPYTEPDRTRFVATIRLAISSAIGRLPARDRLRLACYYAQNLTLAQIGRALREHEATASRHLARTRRTIRKDVERQLEGSGMSEAEIQECFASLVEDPGPLDLAELFGADGKNSPDNRST
jgi:RNA polymerase sigma-70 factor (ECF subfamily)